MASNPTCIMSRGMIAGIWLVLATACGSSPASPSATTASVTITGGAATAPSSGTVIPYASQPVMLLATLPKAMPSAAMTSFVDVASDAAFATIVQTQTASGADGASVQVALSSLASGTYYWRVRTSTTSITSVSSSSTFTIGASAGLSVPQLSGTADGRTAYPRPLLTVSRLSGSARPAGRIVYRFDVARSNNFLSEAVSVEVAESALATVLSYSVRPSADLSLGATYYWRVVAIDTTTYASASSEIRSFTTTSALGASPAALFLTLDCHDRLPTNPPAETIATDGAVVITGSKIVFTAVDSLVLDLTRTEATLAGTIGGFAGERLGGRQIQIGVNAYPASGTVGDAVAEGTYDGYLGFYTLGGSSNGTGCTANGVRWKLYYR